MTHPNFVTYGEKGSSFPRAVVGYAMRRALVGILHRLTVAWANVGPDVLRLFQFTLLFGDPPLTSFSEPIQKVVTYLLCLLC